MMLIKAVLMLIVTLILYFTGVKWIFFCAAFIALLLINYDRIKSRPIPALIPFASLILYMVISALSFYLYSKGNQVLSAVMFMTASLAFMGLLYIVNPREEDKVLPQPKQQNNLLLAARVAAALASGIGAWYLLKHNITVLAVLLYAACLIQAVLLLPYEQKTPAPVLAPLDEKQGPDVDLFFSLLIFTLIIGKAFQSFTNGSFLMPLLFFMLAVMFSGSLFLNGRGVFWEQSGTKKLGPLDYAIILALFAASYYIRTSQPYYPGYAADDYLVYAAVERTYGMGIPIYDSDPTILSPGLFMWLIRCLTVFTGGQLSFIAPKILCTFLGSLEVVFLYLLAFELFRRRVAVFAGIILSTLFIHIEFSRYINYIIEVSVAVTAALYFFVRGMRAGGAANWVFSGIALGFGLYFYSPGKMGPFIVAMFALAAVLTAGNKSAEAKKLAPGFLLTVLTAFIFFFPIFEVMVKYPGIYFQRISYASVFSKAPDLGQFTATMVSQTAEVLKYWFVSGIDYRGLHLIPGRPVLNPINSFLFFMGIAGVIYLWKRRSSQLALIWLALGLLPQFFSWSYSGMNLRSIVAVPAAALMMALGLELAAGGIEKAGGKLMKAVAPVLAATVLVFTCYGNIYDYFTVYLNHPGVKLGWGRGFVDIAEDMGKYGRNSNIRCSSYFFTDGFRVFDGITKTMGAKIQRMDIPAMGLDAVYNKDGKDVLIYSESFYENNLELYREYFPNAEIKKAYNLEYWMYSNTATARTYASLYGWKWPSEEMNEYTSRSRDATVIDFDPASKPYLAFVRCRIPYADIKAAFGLGASFFEGGKPAGNALTDGNIQAPAGCDRIVLKGLMDAKQNGKYAFRLMPSGSLEVYVDGAKADPGNVTLVRGLNRIRINVSGIKGGQVTVEARQPGGDFKAIEYGETLNSDKIFGLLCRTRCEATDITSRYYTMKQRTHWRFVTEPCDSQDREWSGFIRIDEAGYYRIMLRSSYEASVSVDGAVVFSTGVQEPREIFLSKGRHRLQAVEKKNRIYFGKSVQLLMQKRDSPMPREVTYDMLSPM